MPRHILEEVCCLHYTNDSRFHDSFLLFLTVKVPSGNKRVFMKHCCLVVVCLCTTVNLLFIFSVRTPVKHLMNHNHLMFNVSENSD